MRRWLSRPTRARQTFPQVGHVCSELVVDALPARALRASRLVSASFSRLSSVSRAPFVIPARRAERFFARLSHMLSQMPMLLTETFKLSL